MIKFDENNNGLEALVKASKDVIHSDTIRVMHQQGHGLPKIPDQINSYLAAAYSTISKETFNNLIKRWVDYFIAGHETEIFSPSAFETVQNYHSFLSKMGYVQPGDIDVSQTGLGIRIQMNSGCQYATFCEKTGDQKCIRGTVLKYLIHRGLSAMELEFIDVLNRPPDKKDESSESSANEIIGEHNCEIYMVRLDRVLEYMHSRNGKPTKPL